MENAFQALAQLLKDQNNQKAGNDKAFNLQLQAATQRYQQEKQNTDQMKRIMEIFGVDSTKALDMFVKYSIGGGDINEKAMSGDNALRNAVQKYDPDYAAQNGAPPETPTQTANQDAGASNTIDVPSKDNDDKSLDEKIEQNKEMETLMEDEGLLTKTSTGPKR